MQNITEGSLPHCSDVPQYGFNSVLMRKTDIFLRIRCPLMYSVLQMLWGIIWPEGVYIGLGHNMWYIWGIFWPRLKQTRGIIKLGPL